MPNQREKVKTAPSPSLLQRLFGGVMSQGMSEQWPELAGAWASQEIQNPELTSQTNRVMNMGPLTRWLNPNAYAVTGPMGTISLNRGLIEKERQFLPDVLTHELAHIGQGKRGFLRNVYQPSQVENEAINFEAMRSRPKPRDVFLPLETGPTSSKLKKLVK